MANIIDEQPPAGVPDDLREWLQRFATNANIHATMVEKLVGEDGFGMDPIIKPGMRWAGVWNSGTFYKVGDVVRADGWTMICVDDTFEQAAPQPVGEATWGLPATPSWTKPTNTSVVYSGHQYDFSEDGWIQSVRVWAPALSSSTNYRLAIANITDPANPITQVIEEPVLNLDDWTPIGLFNQIVLNGWSLVFLLDSLDSSATTSQTGDWNFEASGNSAPASMGWNTDSPEKLLRISDTDVAAADRTADLLLIIVGSLIQFNFGPGNSTQYRVTANPVDRGNYIDMEVIKTDQAGLISPGDETDMAAIIPTASTTEYVELAGNWPTNNPAWADVNGFLQYDGVNQPGNENDAFGVDILFQPAQLSSDWEIVSFP